MWIGRAPNVAAKLSAIRTEPYGTHITSTVFSALFDPATLVYAVDGPSAARAGGKPLVGRAAVALDDWLSVSGVVDGLTFRRLWATRVGAGLSPKAVGAIIQRRAGKVGLSEAIGGHSLRAGFVTEAGRRGVPLPR